MSASALSAAEMEAVRHASEMEGVDFTLVRERMRLTPTERVERNVEAWAFLQELREAGRRARAGARDEDVAPR
jgi:hypothetical protein